MWMPIMWRKVQVGFAIVSYHSPSQTSSQFDDFLSNFEKLFHDAHGLTYLFEVLMEKFVFSQQYVGWIMMKTAQQNFPDHRTVNSHSYWKQTLCLKLWFAKPNRHLFVQIQLYQQ